MAQAEVVARHLRVVCFAQTTLKRPTAETFQMTHMSAPDLDDGAFHSGFAMLIRRISARSSVSIAAALPMSAPSNASSSEAGAMPTNERVGPDDGEDLQDRRNPGVQLDKEQAIR
jgi:hypothetical protein